MSTESGFPLLDNTPDDKSCHSTPGRRWRQTRSGGPLHGQTTLQLTSLLPPFLQRFAFIQPKFSCWCYQRYLFDFVNQYIVMSIGSLLMIYQAFKVTLDYEGLVGPWHWWGRFQTKMEPDWWDGTFSYSFQMKHQTFAGLQDWLHILSWQEPEATVPQSPDCDALRLGESGEEKQGESGGSRWSRWTG